MATLAQWQSTYGLLKDKLDEAIAATGPKVTLPGGVVVDKEDHVDKLLARMKAIRELVPGVDAAGPRPFTVVSVGR
jgi:hypothetical protein